MFYALVLSLSQLPFALVRLYVYRYQETKVMTRKQDMQQRTERTGKTERDRRNRTDRRGKTEWARQNGILG